MYRAIANVDYRSTIPAVVNEETGTARFIRAALRVVRADRMNTSILPEMGSEDFASLQRDFNDATLPFGISLWAALSRSYNDVG